MPLVLHNATAASRRAGFKYLGYSVFGAGMALAAGRRLCAARLGRKRLWRPVPPRAFGGRLLPPAHIKERSAPFYLYSCRSLWHAFSIEGRCEQSLIETLTFL